MPPKGRHVRITKWTKRGAETKDEESASKRSKKNDGTAAAAKVPRSSAKVPTPKKNVISLKNALPKIAPETYVHPVAREMFKNVEVHLFHSSC